MDIRKVEATRSKDKRSDKYSGRNRKSSVAMTYLTYDQGAYNLSELEMVYKLSKIKIAHHIATSTD